MLIAGRSQPTADLSGDYLAVEVLNIRFVGPNLPLAPGPTPATACSISLLLGEAERESLLAYVETRLHLASGQLPELRVMQGAPRRNGRACRRACHLDDRNWPSAQPLADAASLSVRCLAGAATFVGAPER